MEERLRQIEEALKALHERNARVEADKAWETSVFRMVSIALVTYIVAVLLLYSIGVERAFLAALVPAVGFMLSVQSLPVLKRWWIRQFLKK